MAGCSSFARRRSYSTASARQPYETANVPPPCWASGTPPHCPGGPQVALLVNEPTLLPVLMPLAPAAILPARAARHIATILAANATPDAVIDEELRHVRDYRVATTANRSVVGIMNEFSRLAEVHRDRDRAEPTAHRPSSGAA
jgi:hypothetical protein